MAEWSRAFYSSAAWARCRRAYASSVGYLCESCRARGKSEPATEVHHIVHLTPDNIDDPEISLSWKNLRALCHECHVREHTGRRWTVEDDGRVILPP